MIRKLNVHVGGIACTCKERKYTHARVEGENTKMIIGIANTYTSKAPQNISNIQTDTNDW